MQDQIRITEDTENTTAKVRRKFKNGMQAEESHFLSFRAQGYVI